MKSSISNLCLLLLALCSGCKKYADNPSLSNPAYFRVFNDIASTQTPFNVGAVQPYFTFLVDPDTTASGTVNNGAVVGDFLAQRQPLSYSYAFNENTSNLAGNAVYPQNFDYPGNEHVLTAPVINGFNLSGWAQISSGKHRIMLVTRPMTDTAFIRLPEKAREKTNVVIDTTIDFTAGEVYTMEAVIRDYLSNTYGLYVRKENFIHQTFYSDKLYAGFYNLSGSSFTSTSPDAQPGDEAVRIDYTYSGYQANIGAFSPLPGYDNQYYTTIFPFTDTCSWLELPEFPQSSFFNPQGILQYYDALPTLQFTANTTYYYCNQNPDSVNISNNAATRNNLANIYEITTVNNQTSIQAPVNLFEYVNGAMYMMQLQREAGNPNNN